MAAPIKTDEELDLIERAKRVLPAGGFGNFATVIIIREGRGGRVWDISGNEYVDFLIGSGPMFIGHAHPDVVAAVQAQIPKGSTFFANNADGIELAEKSPRFPAPTRCASSRPAPRRTCTRCVWPAPIGAGTRS